MSTPTVRSTREEEYVASCLHNLRLRRRNTQYLTNIVLFSDRYFFETNTVLITTNILVFDTNIPLS